MPVGGSSRPPSEPIARSAGLAAIATLVSRVLGLIRETVLAAVFGAGNDMDAFNVAFRIPNLVRDLFAEGAMSAAFVPTFARRLAIGGKPDAWRLGNNVMNTLLLVTGVAVAAASIVAAPLVTAYARDYAMVPGKLELTIQLTRVMLPFLTLVALAAVFMGMLNSLGHYFVPALSPAAFNVATIACAVGLTPLMPRVGLPPIMAIAFATLLGGVGQIAVQWLDLRREGYRYAPVLVPRDAALRQVLLLMGPGTLGLAATQVNLFVSTQLAVGEGTGAVSWLQYAFRLMYVPIGLFGVSIATAVLPAVARHVALEDPRAVVSTVARGMALMLVVNVPATVGLFLLATPIVQLLLERGQFQPSDTIATAAAVQCYALGLVGYSAARIASPVFYALGRSRIAVAVSVTSIAANLVLSVVLARALGFRGLALATSGAALVNGGLSVAVLRHQLGGLGGRRLAATFGRIAIASAIMGAVVVGVSRAMPALAPGTSTAAQLFRLAADILAGLLALGAASKALGVRELDEALDMLRARIRTILPR